MRAERRRAERGFTLLEVLIATVIAALALAVLFQGGLGGLRASSRAAREGEALALARSHLAAAAANPAAGEWQGTEGDGFRWQVRITALAATAPGAFGATALFGIQVAVSWPEGAAWRRVELASAALGPAGGGR